MQHYQTTPKAVVDGLIIDVIMPQLYVVIDDLLDELGEENTPKELLVRAKKLLPDWAPHSMLQRPMPKKQK